MNNLSKYRGEHLFRRWHLLSTASTDSTVGDMLKYDRVLYENRLLSQETKETMFSAARARISGNFEVEQALKLLDRYLRITKGKSKRTEAAVWWLKGQAYELFGNREKAIESYETSLQSDTEFKRSEESLKKLKLKKQM